MLEGLILRLILFNTSINDLKVATLIKFADDTKLGIGEGETVNMPEKTAAIQQDLERLKEWADRNHVKFSQDQCPVQHQRRSSSFH